MFENFTPPPFTTYIIPFFFILIGIEVWISIRKQKKFYRLNVSIADLSTGIVSQLWGLFQRGIGLVAYFFIYEHFKIFEFSLVSPFAWLLCLLLQDFLFYWFHRISHEVNFFWAAHVLHHYSEEYNLIVALRLTGLGGLFSWVFNLPLAFLGFHPWMFLGVGQINLIYQFWVHTKTIDKIGKVGEYLLSTPSHHRVHHSINTKYIDRNHGGIFIIWDRMFGTFQEEEEECVYGTVEPLQSFNPVYANFYYYLKLFKQSFYAKGIMNKIKVFFKPPGWIPSNGEKPADFLPIPEVNPRTFVKYDPKVTGEVYSYAVAWFVGILVGSFAVLLFIGKLSLISQILFAVWVTLSLVSINEMMEGKPHGQVYEMIRLVFGFWLLSYFELGWGSYAIGVVFLLMAGIFFYRIRTLDVPGRI